jgi:16S rRNA (guanine(527)-N(7))-methyltransferase RsmG
MTTWRSLRPSVRCELTMAEKELNSRINEIFRMSGFELTTRQIDQFGAYYDLLMEQNEALDLTRLKTFEDIVVKHFIDSIYFTEYVELPSPLMDIGSGAGFPGIPLKIYIPGLDVILAEPRKKRASFLEETARALRLSGVRVYPHMVTGLTDFPVQGVITRALEPVDETLARVLHFLPRGGKAIFMKGPEADTDLDGISKDNRSAYTMELDRHYTLPLTDYERRIIVFKKETGETRKTYAILKDLTATMGTAVTSGENKKFKELKKLSTGEGIRKSGSILVSGKKIISEIAKRGDIPVRELVLCDGSVEDDAAMNAIIRDFAGRGSLLVLKKALYNELDQFNTRGPLLAAGVPEMKAWDLGIGPGCTLLIPFQDPVNVGSAIRSAVGFNVGKIVMLKEAANPFHPKSVRTSAGTVFSAHLERGPSLYELPALLADRMAAVISLDAEGTPLASFSFPGQFLLLPGIEGPGLPETLKTRAVSIPLNKAVESLNGPVALSIALYELSRHSPSN